MRRGSRWLASFLFGALVLQGAASAEVVDKQLALYETEARALGTDLPKPNQRTGEAGVRLLVDAEVAFTLGDYDTAALALFELSSKPGAEQETATYYLAESLYQKQDRGAARNYYEQVVAMNNGAGRYYQPSLLRLVEIAITQRDSTNVANHLAAIERIAPAGRLPQVAYIRGKFAFSEGKYDEALAYFQDVPKASDHELQATYYAAASHVAKKDLGRATEMFTDIISRKPRTPNDRRVIELSQLALGRLFYERDQPSRSIESYLLIDRRSDLFPDALYEVAWVYVKGKRYDKALRALELLHLTEQQTNKTPTLRLLEGNLRIRKAQMIRDAQITGTLDANYRNADPSLEYDKAAQVFSETHDMYMPSYTALSLMVDSTADPAQYLAQLAGRSPKIFQTTVPMPEAAAQYLRDEPEVQRIVSVEVDLGEIESNIALSEQVIERLEGVLSAGDRTAVYPQLASRRSRIGQIQDDLIKIRNGLAEEQLRLVDSSGELSGLSATRKQLAAQYATLPNAETTRTTLIEDTNRQYDTVDLASGEVTTVLDSTQAMAVALRKYSIDVEIPADQKTQLIQTLDQSAREAAEIEAEIASINREIVLGRDLAGVGDSAVATARDARSALRVAQDAEHRVLAGFASSSRDAAKSQRLASLGDRAARVADNLAQTEAAIDASVDRGMEEVKVQLAKERVNLGAYKVELTEYDAESRAIGGTVLGASFKGVKAKFYDIIIRTDVGSVDVSWSQKEDNEDDVKRLGLSRQRELKQLQDEFRDILKGPASLKPIPAKNPNEGDPSTAPKAPAGSPDKGATDGRVTPGSGKPAEPAPPVVRPDAAPTGTQPKGTQPKAGTR